MLQTVRANLFIPLFLSLLRLAASIDKALNLSLAVALNPDGLRADAAAAEKKSNTEHVFKVRTFSNNSF